jgi:cbb3-type cytochrome oxidase maturation protein
MAAGRKALMSVLLLLIPVSVALASVFMLICLASIRGGQFDDLESPRWRILFDSNSDRPDETVSASAFPLPETLPEESR